MFAVSGYKGLFQSDAEQEANSCNNPLCLLLLCLQVEGPDKGWPSSTGLIDRALVDIFGLLLVDWDGPDEDDWHTGG